MAFELYNSNGVYGDGDDDDNGDDDNDNDNDDDDDDDDDNHHKSDQHQISPCHADALSEWS